MRASRLLSILLLLQNRGRMTAEALAEDLAVSVRTIYRDIEALGTAGVPVYGDSGPGGGFALLAGYRTRLTGLTVDEAQSLVLAGMPGPAAELGLGAVVASTAEKLRAAMPAELSERAERIQARFHFDAPGWYHDGDPSPHLAAVADAVWQQHRIAIRYRRWKAPVEVTRELEPYGVVLKAGRWYVVASDVERPGPRTYRVNQIVALSTVDERFDRPVDFDLGAYWRGHLADFRERLWQGEATVRVSAAGRERIGTLMAGAVADSVEASASEPDARGWVTATMPIESLIHAHTEMLKLGAEVEVLAPEELRQMVSATAASLAVIYRE
ncbi:MAG TPA: YafY family protein [Micromonosporaceae bacterium]